MKRPSYTLKFDKIRSDGATVDEYSVGGFRSLELAREAYADALEALRQTGHRTAHDRIVGPLGEVYSTQEPAERVNTP